MTPKTAEALAWIIFPLAAGGAVFIVWVIANLV